MQEVKEPLAQLVNIPIDEYELQKFLTYVELHGVTFKITATREHFSEYFGRGVHYLCTIDFPLGTYRVFEEEGPISTPFTIHFPDGGTMPGALVKRNNTKPGETPTSNMLYVKGGINRR